MNPVATTIEQKTLIDILIWAARQGDGIQSIPEKVQKIQEMTAPYFRKLNSRELETLLKTDYSPRLSMFSKNAFIYLPPVEKGEYFVPILCVEYDYSVTIPTLHLRVALFLISDNNGEETLKAIGYRFETPHENERHHYCHIQQIRELANGRRFALPGSEWMPLEYPAFPLDAQSPVELLVCLLISLYDIKLIRSLESEINTQLGIKKMRLYNQIVD